MKVSKYRDVREEVRAVSKQPRREVRRSSDRLRREVAEALLR